MKSAPKATKESSRESDKNIDHLPKIASKFTRQENKDNHDFADRSMNLNSISER